MILHSKAALSAISAGKKGERHQKDDFKKKASFRTVPYKRINKVQSNPLKANERFFF